MQEELLPFVVECQGQGGLLLTTLSDLLDQPQRHRYGGGEVEVTLVDGATARIEEDHPQLFEIRRHGPLTRSRRRGRIGLRRFLHTRAE